MNKSILTLLAVIGMSMGTASAQNCCVKEKEVCEPIVCCPTTPSCCEEQKISKTDDQKNKTKKSGKTKNFDKKRKKLNVEQKNRNNEN